MEKKKATFIKIIIDNKEVKLRRNKEGNLIISDEDLLKLSKPENLEKLKKSLTKI
jgi:hypothetical protein